MKAVEVRAFGGPEVMRVVELPEPVVGTEDVLIEADAIGVNFHDLCARLGFPGLVTLPFVEGIEVTGRVVAGGGQFRVGERVIGLPLFGHGAYAERVVVPAEYVYAIPDAMPMDAAASFGVNFLTAYAALHYTARLRRGERVLVHAAAGGVGTAAVQLAQCGGAEVLGTASLAKHGSLKALGVRHVVDYRSEDWVAEVRSRTGGEGVDVILDPIGGEISRRSLELLRYGGRLVCYGISDLFRDKQRLKPQAVTSWESSAFPAAPLLSGATAVMGCHLGAPPAMLRSWMTQLLQMYVAGSVAPRVDRVFKLSEAPAAHQYIHDRLNVGKVLLTPR